MFKYFILALLLAVVFTQQNDIDNDKLILSMQVEEKSGQMTQIEFDVIAKGEGTQPKGKVSI
jgi:hypothetical protein